MLVFFFFRFSSWFLCCDTGGKRTFGCNAGIVEWMLLTDVLGCFESDRMVDFFQLKAVMMCPYHIYHSRHHRVSHKKVALPRKKRKSPCFVQSLFCFTKHVTRPHPCFQLDVCPIFLEVHVEDRSVYPCGHSEKQNLRCFAL